MNPRFPGYDFANGRFGYAETYRDLLLFNPFGMQPPDTDNGRFAEFRAPVPLALGLPALHFAISHVLQVRSGKNMRRAKACRVVAAVADLFSRADHAEGKSVSNSVGVIAPFRDAQARILSPSVTPGPYETFVSFWNCLEHFAKKVVTANLVSHISALHKRGCMALAMFAHRGATSILPPKIYQKGTI